MQSRQELRTRMRRERRQLSASERKQRAAALARHISGHPLFLRSRRIAGYLAVSGEMDTLPVLHHALAMGKSAYLPALVRYRHNRLRFAPYRVGVDMALNRFGIPEPDLAWRYMTEPTALDLVLVPLVAFDLHGNRLGMGGGFYDRTFAFLRHRKRWRKPHLIGVAYDFQRVERLHPEAWDVPLTAIATESGIYLPHH